jgi:hypothetical protein
MFFVGFRKNPHPPGGTQRVGTAILKRSYSIDASSGTLTPLADPVPIYVTDRRDNVVRNSDFVISERLLLDPEPGSPTLPAFWSAEGLVAELENEDDCGHGENPVHLSGTDPAGRLTQTVHFSRPLGGRCFQFSFYVSADTAEAEIKEVYLQGETDSDRYLVSENVPIRSEDGDEEGYTRVIQGGRFPAGLAAQELTIVLPIATDPDTGATVETTYDRVQLEERDHVSAWDPDYILRRESDLVPYKPHSDIIVSGFTQVGGTCKVQVNGQTILERHCNPNEKSLFGWEPRVNVDEDGRHADRGTFSQEPEDYPPPPPEEGYPPELKWPARDPLPSDFKNAYFNGHRRDVVGPVPAYLSSDARITILRKGSLDYALSLAGERYEAAYYVLEPGAPDAQAFWQGHALALNLDTLVVEPDRNLCTAVWRGVWDFDRHAEDDYRKLEIALL